MHVCIHAIMHSLSLGNCSNSTRYNTLSTTTNSDIQFRVKLATGQHCDCIQLSPYIFVNIDDSANSTRIKYELHSVYIDYEL